jgi:hypothetical protein
MDESPDDACCAVCGNAGQEAVFFCDAGDEGDECNFPFHATCAGYSRPLVAAEEFWAYCADCRRTNNVTANEILWQQDEAAFLKQFLRSPDCAFKLERVKGDGTCMFGALWRWIELVLERSNRVGLKSRAALIKRVANEALSVIDGKSDDELPPEERKNCVAVWQAIRDKVGNLRMYWDSEALDYCWVAMVKLYPWIKIEIWQFGPNSEQPKIVQTYPHDADVASDAAAHKMEVLSVLLTNRRILAHYDLLLPKDNVIIK